MQKRNLTSEEVVVLDQIELVTVEGGLSDNDGGCIPTPSIPKPTWPTIADQY